LTALAFRVLAAYFGFIAIQYASMTAQMSTPMMRFATRRPLPSWQVLLIPTALYILGGVALLWYSFRLAPKSKDEDEGPLEFDQLKNLAFLVLGTFFFVNTLPLLLTDIVSTFRLDMFPRQPGVDRWIYDIGASLAGLGLIVANAPKKEQIPGFDEMRTLRNR